MATKINGLQITNRVTTFIRRPQIFQTPVGIYRNYFIRYFSPTTARFSLRTLDQLLFSWFHYFIAPYCIYRCIIHHVLVCKRVVYKCKPCKMWARSLNYLIYTLHERNLRNCRCSKGTSFVQEYFFWYTYF